MEKKLIQSDTYEVAGSYGSTDSTILDVDGSPTSSCSFDNVVTNIYTVNSNCRFLDQASKAIGTTRDSVKLRNSVQTTLIKSKTTIDSTKSELKELMISAKKQDRDQEYKLQLEKISNNLKEAVESFSALQKVLLIKLRRNLPTEPCPIQKSNRKRVSYAYDDEEDFKSLQKSIQSASETDNFDIIEREDALRKLENDVVDINEIMHDLGTMIDAQADTVDLIENIVEDTHTNVESGYQELEKALQYQRKRRTMLVYLFLLLLLVVIVFATVVYLALR